MEILLELLEKIKYCSEWSDDDSRLALVLYLDEICGLAIDAIEMLKQKEMYPLYRINELGEIKLFDFEKGN